jgi:phosphatidylinositol alpha-1,6-mannosyltransferase
VNLELPQPVLFSFDYPPLGGGISRLCSEIVDQSSVLQGVRFNVVSGTEARPWREISAILKLMKTAKAPYCICGLWYPEGLIATLVGAKGRVILAHGSELLPTRQWWRRALWAKLQRWVLSRADLVVANSHYTAALVKAMAPQAEVLALPLAVDTQKFAPGKSELARQELNLPQKFIITTVTRLYEYKGIDTVFKAIALLPQDLKQQILYVIAGTGPDKGMLENLARELGIEKQIQWLGFVEEKKLPFVYQAADIFVLCTRENIKSREVEGFGLVFLEAQASGTPTIGTRAGGIPDAVSEGNGGWLVAQDDAEAVSQRLQTLMRNPEELKKQKQLARERTEKSCTWKTYITHLFLELKKRGVSDV